MFWNWNINQLINYKNIIVIFTNYNMTNYNYIIRVNIFTNCHSLNLIDDPVDDSDYDISWLNAMPNGFKFGIMI